LHQEQLMTSYSLLGAWSAKPSSFGLGPGSEGLHHACKDNLWACSFSNSGHWRSYGRPPGSPCLTVTSPLERVVNDSNGRDLLRKEITFKEFAHSSSLYENRADSDIMTQ